MSAELCCFSAILDEFLERKNCSWSLSDNERGSTKNLVKGEIGFFGAYSLVILGAIAVFERKTGVAELVCGVWAK